jgi:hopanoid-associated phosphorylase
MILAATGLLREARIVGGGETTAIAGGGDQPSLEARLDAVAPRAKAIASIGIAGGLAPRLRVGAWVVADRVLADDAVVTTDEAWSAFIAERLGDATRGLLLGRNAMVMTASEKALLHRTTAALAVDMESHVAARVAKRHRLPFVAARVICDPASHSLPPAACVGMKPDGAMDIVAVLRSLLSRPGQLPALIGVALDAERAFAALLRGHRRLGPRLGFPDLGELGLDVP